MNNATYDLIIRYIQLKLQNCWLQEKLYDAIGASDTQLAELKATKDTWNTCEALISTLHNAGVMP